MRAKPKLHKGGRKRQSGPRTASGLLKACDAAPLALLRRRAAMAGVTEAVARSSPLAGYALGLLRLRGVIGQDQHDAGLRFAVDWNRWALLAGLPAHQLRLPTGGTRPESGDAEWLRVRDRYLAACARVRPFWPVIEAVVMDDWPDSPESMALFLERPQAVAALKSGLDFLASFYRIGACGREEKAL
ncbi:hypothetical protein GALL_207580 [mine drainage metagenome]|uniref:Uncharacterized protein n=1 Tax=mine drainage metagenome TaxID=410659 RepID=A0A1J5RYP1_9ZZZZ